MPYHSPAQHDLLHSRITHVSPADATAHGTQSHTSARGTACRGQAPQLLAIHLIRLLLFFSFAATHAAASSDLVLEANFAEPHDNTDTMIVEQLLRTGVFRFVGQGGLKVIDELVAKGALRVGSLSGTNGRVFELNTAVPRQCVRPDSVLICAWCRNVGHSINEWLVYHLWTVGVNHVVVYDDHSSDNTRAVLKPWSDTGLVSVRASNRSYPPLSQWRSYTSCFQDFGSRYTWTAFIDIDEFIVPLSNPCLPEILDAYAEHGGLSVGYSITASPRLFARRSRLTVFEATNFSLGFPHPLVKPICYSSRTLGPSYHMPHCCEFHEGYKTIDETFANDPANVCWVIPYDGGFKPRQHITVMHIQASSFEEMVQRRIRKTELPPHGTSFEFKEGVNLTSVWRQFKLANQNQAVNGVQPSDAVVTRMKAFRHVLDLVLVGRGELTARITHV